MSRRFSRLGMMLLLVLGGAGAAVAAPRAAATPVRAPFVYQALGVSEGCFVESVAFYDFARERLGGEGAWVRVLQWGAKEDDEVVAGHAVAVFLREGVLWGWDVNFGFAPLALDPAQRDDVGKVTPLLTARYPRVDARFPVYRHAFAGESGGAAEAGAATSGGGGAGTGAATPAGGGAGIPERTLRDAQSVAERLRRHRAVNVVGFSFVKDGATQRSAAAVFIFHGRLCVYFPAYGTIPFRARALSIDNLRQLQEAFRRAYPGASGLQRLTTDYFGAPSSRKRTQTGMPTFTV